LINLFMQMKSQKSMALFQNKRNENYRNMLKFNKRNELVQRIQKCFTNPKVKTRKIVISDNFSEEPPIDKRNETHHENERISNDDSADLIESTLNFNKLMKLNVLGKGRFGKVYLVSDTQKNEPFALKLQSKKSILDRKESFSIMQEKNIMEMLDHPFIIKLIHTFQDKKYLCLITKVYLGGTLFGLMRETKPFGMIEKQGRFYAACVLEGLSHMHCKNVCHRDLKPENILLDKDGYCVIVDLGFSKVITSKSHTLCGTPLYAAPEIILQLGHNQSADVWAFGMIIFELIIGDTPFYSPGMNQIELFKKICSTKYTIDDSKCSSEAENLFKNIFCFNPQERMSCSCNHSTTTTSKSIIHEHAWFQNIDFKLLIERKVEAPWVPNLKDKFDCEYFG